MTLQERIDASWESGELDQEAVEETLALLDKGSIRVAEQQGDDWLVHDWIKKAILLFFRCSKMEVHEVGPYEFYDKIPLKKNLGSARSSFGSSRTYSLWCILGAWCYWDAGIRQYRCLCWSWNDG